MTQVKMSELKEGDEVVFFDGGNIYKINRIRGESRFDFEVVSDTANDPAGKVYENCWYNPNMSIELIKSAPKDFAAGDKVNFISGAFKGKTGTIQRPWTFNPTRFDVRIDGLQTAYDLRSASAHEMQHIDKKENGMNEFQNKVFDHLTSGEGDPGLRLKALRMLTEDQFFSKYSTEDGPQERLRFLMVEARYREAFCASGRQRVLDLIDPPEPKGQQRARLVIEFDVTPGQGITPLFEVDEPIERMPQIVTALEGLRTHRSDLGGAPRTLNNVSLVSIEEVK